MEIHVVDPLSDGRWDVLVKRHPRASVFHEPGWLEALNRTYRYKPFVLTTAAPGEPLENGVLGCRVHSWITGTRVVCLPFSDHCDPLINERAELEALVNCLEAECDRRNCAYVEVRPLSIANEDAGFQPSCSYWFHELDLTPSLDKIFCGFHSNSFQRKIRRAEREHVSYEAGNSPTLLDAFYHLLLLTRRRHQLLPQPRTWFQNLLKSMRDRLQIRIARKDGIAIAAMLTLRHKSSVVYKYGCSDHRFHNLGGMPFLFWKLVEESKATRAQTIDLGRTDLDNQGLITFKSRLGAKQKLLTYYRYTKAPKGVNGLQRSHAIRRLLSILPESLSVTAGRVLYRHMG